MKLAEGVQLHLIKHRQYKTNHITFRFSGEYLQKTVARRALVAQMLATASQKYPNSLSFRKKLASLYGTNLSTSVSRRGKTHIVDIELSFIKDKYTFQEESLLEDVFHFLEEILLAPLVSIAKYSSKVFELERDNMARYLEADKDDVFYSSQLSLQELYYNDNDLKTPKYGKVSTVLTETSYSAYQEFQRMLNQDILDIFVVGEYDDYRMIQLFNQLSFSDRHKQLVLDYHQPYSNLIPERTHQLPVQQSILNVAYHFPISVNERNFLDATVAVGMLANYAHSLIFAEIREKRGLAYQIGASFDGFTDLLSVYAGIDKDNRDKVLKLISQQLSRLKCGRFSNDLLTQTKRLLLSQRKALEDNIYYLIEQRYLREHLKLTYSFEEWCLQLEQISKDDIIKVMRQVKLQALYFIEGQG
ncbi:EF-P 5-aminopentanol modification-associated protein YfmF [Streptococcus sp. zg-JUN1979]|uniref:EF-P 5-aminopentanol modification-associated protein YfmF n=1 Tax=Streptococcus sp. zg-JUN1979 TaxID=3391450 RepID=UPI0039A67E83